MGLTLEGNKRLPIEVIKGEKSVDIASGGDHLVILTKSGHLYTVGCAEQGQLGRISTRAASGESRRGKTQLLKPDIVIYKAKKLVGDAIWASTYCTYFREKASSKIFAFGLNNYNQLGLGKKFKAVPMFNPVQSTFDDVKQIAGGQHHTIVLKNDNKVYVVGRKEYGRLGLGALESDAVEMTLIEKLAKEKIVEISCGESTSFAITDEGKVYAWGFGSNQQLGTGKEDYEIEPALLTGAQVKDKRVLKVSSGGQHTLFIVEDKTPQTNGHAEKEVTKKPAKKEKKVEEPVAEEPEVKEPEVKEPEVKEPEVKELEEEKMETETAEVTSTTKSDDNEASSTSTEVTADAEKKKPAAKGRKRKA